MRHGVSKIKVRAGKDANKMLVRKLTRGFLLAGNLKTTLKKAKMIKSVIDNLVSKTKAETTANRNYIMSKVNDKKLTDRLFSEVGPAVKNVVGGYVKLVRLGVRLSDGSEIAQLKWAYPVIKEKPVQPVAPVEKK